VTTPEIPMCRTFDKSGNSICTSPARFIVWGHLYEKLDKGPKCRKHLPKVQGMPTGYYGGAVFDLQPWIEASR